MSRHASNQLYRPGRLEEFWRAQLGNKKGTVSAELLSLPVLCPKQALSHDKEGKDWKQPGGAARAGFFFFLSPRSDGEVPTVDGGIRFIKLESQGSVIWMPEMFSRYLG